MAVRLRERRSNANSATIIFQRAFMPQFVASDDTKFSHPNGFVHPLGMVRPLTFSEQIKYTKLIFQTTYFGEYDDGTLKYDRDYSRDYTKLM